MSSRANTLSILGLLAATAVACSGQPVGLSAQAGSTLTIPVAGEAVQNATLGFGNTILAAGQRFDDQRGELVFVLANTSTGADVSTLVTRTISRVYPDPGTDVGIQNQLPHAYGSILGVAEVVAVLDIPTSTPQGVYDIKIRRCRRQTAGGACLPLIGDVFYSAGGVAPQLTILPGMGTPTPALGYLGSQPGEDAAASLRGLYPYPKLVLNYSVGGTLPAAARVVVTYPKLKLAIKTVFEEQHLGRSSIVSFTDDATNGRLTIDCVDPTQTVKSLAIAFDLISPFGVGAALASDFAVVAADTRLYDANGAVISGGTVSLGMIR